MLAAGTHTADEIRTLRSRKRHSEEVQVCRMMLRAKSWRTDEVKKKRLFLLLLLRYLSL
jgi:hypothetical protein